MSAKENASPVRRRVFRGGERGEHGCRENDSRLGRRRGGDRRTLRVHARPVGGVGEIGRHGRRRTGPSRFIRDGGFELHENGVRILHRGRVVHRIGEFHEVEYGTGRQDETARLETKALTEVACRVEAYFRPDAKRDNGIGLVAVAASGGRNHKRGVGIYYKPIDASAYYRVGTGDYASCQLIVAQNAIPASDFVELAVHVVVAVHPGVVSERERPFRRICQRPVVDGARLFLEDESRLAVAEHATDKHPAGAIALEREGHMA